MYPSLSLSKKADYQNEHNTTVKYPSESISNQTVIIKHNNEVYKVLQMDTDTDIKGYIGTFISSKYIPVQIQKTKH